MMKSRSLITLAIGLFVLGIALITFLDREQEPLQTFSARINNDCAPWDGAAFTVSVQYDPQTVIYISIYQSPIIEFPSTFSIPDEYGQIVYAYILPELGPYTILNGKVSFQRVSVDEPVEGRFTFMSEGGEQFEGQFIAEWQNEVVYCG
jgi:hypothetical protein